MLRTTYLLRDCLDVILVLLKLLGTNNVQAVRRTTIPDISTYKRQNQTCTPTPKANFEQIKTGVMTSMIPTLQTAQRPGPTHQHTSQTTFVRSAYISMEQFISISAPPLNNRYHITCLNSLVMRCVSNVSNTIFQKYFSEQICCNTK